MTQGNLIDIKYKEDNVTKTYNLSQHIPMGTYNVNVLEEFEEWTDSNYDIHRKLLRNRVEGTFDLKFYSIDAYEEFLNVLTKAKTTTGQQYIEMDAFATNKGTSYNKKFYYEFAPKNDLPQMADCKNNAFTVTIKEARA